MTREHIGATGGGPGWEFEDDRGVRVTLSRPPERVVGYGQIAAALWDEGVRPAGHFGSQHDGDTPDPAKSGLLPLDEVPYFGAGGALHVERLLAAEPELLVGVTYDGKSLYGVDERVAQELAARVPVVALDVGPGRGLGEVAGRLVALVRSLGVTGDVATADGAEQLTGAGERLRAVAASGPEVRVLALSPAGADAAYLARGTVWPDLRALAEHGVTLVAPPAGEGTNWAAGGWADALALAPGIVLTDVRANAARPDVFEHTDGWRALASSAVVVPWNPELPPSRSAQARFFDTLAGAIGRARGE
ncbi:ABC transporter substrate-binding protein [Streptomyces profundus]|uniref:ABC transporter substrate-binding protein n=1 Tax=Streptomyces profundus TaxID=2867410 RepID=UPI001D16AAC2|nr:ABC transporter substrate-binding protein [Streptomyces sp. MA3_2.13]UED87352.1 ABC transporter substrate-binding protein [Streptomyces sp. MA3_2.13]